MTEQPKTDPRTVAYTAPFLVFMGLLAIPDLLAMTGWSTAVEHPEIIRLWLYPIQVVVCLIVLVIFWKRIEFGPHNGWILATGCGLLGIIVWILPGHLYRSMEMSEGWWKYFGFAPRVDGFDPALAGDSSGPAYLANVAVRFLRLVVVVPLVEEVFWRGFLMRYVAELDGDYWQVPFGKHHRNSLLIVTLAFVMVHAPVDYPGAVVFGTLMYGVAIKTKSLSSCVLMHAVANLILGAYVMATGQWGYW